MAQRVTAGGRRGARGAGGAAGAGPVRAALSRAAGTAIRAWSRRAAVLPRVVRVPGHGADTRVRFDEHGVPHVRAETEADAFRALGVCHALDRFFQMDVTRRLLRGRLAETVGERSLGERAIPPLAKGGTTTDLDRLMRVLRLVPAAQRVLDAASDEERHLLDAYVDGVNAGLFRARRPKPPEVALLGGRPEPWTGLDTCLLAKGMAVGLSFKWRAGPVCAAMAAELEGKPELLRGVLPRAPDAGTPTIAAADPAARGLAAALGVLGWHAPPAGSNAWVVAGTRTASGFPILASDPHLELSLPPVWYLASVVGGRYQCVGATMPGTPGVVIGRTPTVAWGLTNAMLDDGDLWVEEIDGTGTRHLVDGAWRDLGIETHEIRRRGAAPTVFRVRHTHRGPILTDAFPGYEGKPLSLRLSLYETTREMPVFLRLGRARTADDVEAAAADYGSPAQNLVYATTEKVAGYRFLGAVPKRAPGGDPALPRDGTRSDTDWAGWHPPTAAPRFRLEKDGFLVTANDPHAGPENPVYFSCLYEPIYRATRLRALLEKRTGTTCADHAAIQMDSYSLGAEAFRRLVLLPVADAVRETRPAAARLLDRCLLATGWERAEDVGPALLHFAHHHLLLRVFSPHLGEGLVKRWMGCVNLVEERLLEAFRDPESPWAKPAVRAALVADALEAAGKDLEARGLPTDAPWGAVHALTLRHAMSSIPFLGDAWTRGPFPMAGGPYTVQAGQYLHDRPAAMIVGASYRQVVDLADPEGTARFVLFGGQSGHVGSPHYDDLTPLWRRNEMFPMRLSTWPEKGRDLVVRAG